MSDFHLAQTNVVKAETLRRMGPTNEDLTFCNPFPAPDADQAPQQILDECA
jgi:hypothetical protein